MSPRDVRALALALPTDDRAGLVRDLLDSLDGALPDDDIARAAYTDEIDQRVQDVAEGRVELVAWEDVKADLQARRTSR